MLKRFLSGYLSFTRKERTGTLVLLFIIILFSVFPLFYPLFIKRKDGNSSTFEKEIARLKAGKDDSSLDLHKRYNSRYSYQSHYNTQPANYNKPVHGELFAFDPNTLPPEGWARLGIRDKTIGTIRKYIAKGGHFYKPEDIGKIWGLHEDEVKRLLPYVRISEVKKENYSAAINDNPIKRIGYKDPGIIVNINTADSSMFMKLKGIGQGLSHRIIAFREKLGGFYKTDQVGETYGLPDSTFKLIRAQLAVDNPQVKQININTATVEELKAHPYIRYYLANAIVQYRTQHGNFPSVEGLKKLTLITNEIYDKLAPYCKTD